MANVFKRTYYRTNKAGQRVKHRTRKWYGQFRVKGDVHRVPLCTDKTAAKAMLNEKIREAEREAAGLVDPFDKHRKRPLAQHLVDYRHHLELAGDSSDYVGQSVHRIETILCDCKFVAPADFDAARVVDWLRDLKARGRSHGTINYYLTNLKGFVNWMVRDRRLPHNPFMHLSRLNTEVDVRIRRRNLPPEEFQNLVEAAAGSDRVYRRLTGQDRAMLYVVAAYSGLRAAELASLTEASLALAGDPPTISVAAGYTKRRRLDVQPLPRWLADRVSAWLESRESPVLSLNGRSRLWSGSWKGRAAEMLRDDLEVAGIPYVDDSGRVFDFHALRHQFISGLALAGVHPREAQQLARHSTINLTMNTYTHLGLSDVAGAVDKLPELPSTGTRPTPKDARKTG